MISKKILYSSQERVLNNIKLWFAKETGVRDLVKYPAKIQEQHLTLTPACAKLKLNRSHNSHANENHVVHLIRLENGSDDQTNKN